MWCSRTRLLGQVECKTGWIAQTPGAERTQQAEENMGEEVTNGAQYE